MWYAYATNALQRTVLSKDDVKSIIIFGKMHEIHERNYV